jgi:hypothetical protein
MSRSMNKTPHRATDCSDQTGCRLKDESTTPPYQRRPGTASGTSAVLWPQTAASPSVRQESSHGLGPRVVPGITARGVRRLPAPVHRLLLLLRQERAQATEPALLIWPMLIG